MSEMLEAFEEYAKKFYPGFVIDKDNRDFFEAFIMWAHWDPRFENIKRGFSLKKDS